MKKDIIKYSVINSTTTFFYIVLVVVFMFSMEGVGPETNNSIFVPIFMLMLLVFSVAIVGTMIFGRPVMWYLDNKKKEALKLLIYTFGIFFLIMFLVILFMIIFSF